MLGILGLMLADYAERNACAKLRTYKRATDAVHDKKSGSVGSAESGRMLKVHVALLCGQGMWVR